MRPNLQELLAQWRAAKQERDRKPPRSMVRYALEGLAFSAALTVFLLILFLLFGGRYSVGGGFAYVLLIIPIYAILGPSSEPLTWIFGIITFLAVILFCIRRFMQG